MSLHRPLVERLDFAITEVVVVLEAARRQAEDTRSQLGALARSNGHLGAGGTANLNDLARVENAMRAETLDGFSWIVECSTGAETGEATTQVQDVVTEARRAAGRLAAVAVLAQIAYEDSARHVEQLLEWLKRSEHTIDREVVTGRREETWDAVERVLPHVRALAPHIYRYATVKRTSVGSTATHDGSLRDACANLALAFDHAIDAARDLRRAWEDIQRS